MPTDPPPSSQRRRRRLRRRDEPDESSSRASEEIARKLAEIGDVKVTEVMTPRIDVESLVTPVGAAEVAKAVRESGHSCYPVVLDDLDDLVGLLFVKDLFRAGRGDLLEGGEPLSTVDISKKVRTPLLLPESLDVLEALGEMRAEHRSVALVVDEHGGVSGLVSLKDLLGALVGDLTDELAAADEPEVVRVDAQRWLVDGQITLDDLAEQIGLALPDGDYVTLGGFILDDQGDIPDEGAEVEFEGWKLKVTEMDKRRIAEVLVHRPVEGEAEEPSGEGA